VSGLVGTPRAARSNRTWQSFFVNGRYIRSNRLSQALEQTYGIRLMQHRHPVCALHIALPPGRVDVNISPNKMEVRFKDEPELLNLLASAVQRGLQEGGTAHTLTPGPLPGAFKKPEEAPPETGMLRFGFEGRAPRILEVRESVGMMPVQESTQELVGRTQKEEIAESLLLAQEAAEQASPPGYRVLGQLFRTYLVVEMGESMYIVDQHAAHERILYDRFSVPAAYRARDCNAVPGGIRPAGTGAGRFTGAGVRARAVWRARGARAGAAAHPWRRAHTGLPARTVHVRRRQRRCPSAARKDCQACL